MAVKKDGTVGTHGDGFVRLGLLLICVPWCSPRKEVGSIRIAL